MTKLSILLCVVFITNLFANKNQIQVSGAVQANANTQMKMTHVNDTTIQQDILLQTNHNGLTLSISDSSYSPSSYVWLNDNRMSRKPLDFSNGVYAKFTKVGELVISKNKYLNTLALTISIK